MSFWEFIGLPSKKRIEEQNKMISDLSEGVKEIKTQQEFILSLMKNNEEHISEGILLNNEVAKETKTKVISLVTDSEKKNEVLNEILSKLNVTSNQVTQINESNFAESIQSLNNVNTKSFMQMYDLIKESNNSISILEENSIKPIFEEIKTQQGFILSFIKNNEEHISKCISLNNEAAKETKTKVISLVTDSEKKNEVLNEILSKLNVTSNQVEKINESNIAESIQSLNNVNIKYSMKIYDLIKELKNSINDLEQNSIKPISKNLSVIEEISRLMLVNDLIDDAEEAMRYLKESKHV